MYSEINLYDFFWYTSRLFKWILEIGIHNQSFGWWPFFIPLGPNPPESLSFSFKAPTTQDNLIRVQRGLALDKPLLLEGSPGVGKPSLVVSLDKMSGYELVRINISEQTDLIDLLGSDLPVENGIGEFAWKDGPFLQALQLGKWVLLDELNLASQQVLEGLNACFDHRASIYIPELKRSFTKHPNFRVFATQNPCTQGGGRKGLPKSFGNRFTCIYLDDLKSLDLEYILSNDFAHSYVLDINLDFELQNVFRIMKWIKKMQVKDVF